MLYYLGRAAEANWYLANGAKQVQQWMQVAQTMASSSSIPTLDDVTDLAWNGAIWKSDDGSCEIVSMSEYDVRFVEDLWASDDDTHNPGVTRWNPEDHGFPEDSILVMHRGTTHPIFFDF